MFFRMFAAALAASAWPILGVGAWNYAKFGQDWSDLGSCGRGGTQSPIDLPAAASPANGNKTLFFKYPKLDVPFTVYHNGKSIAITLPSSFKAGFGVGNAATNPESFRSDTAETYRLWQITFHAPSEHTLNGRRMPLEVQFTHSKSTGRGDLSVIVILYEEGGHAAGGLLESIVDQGGLPTKPWMESTIQSPQHNIFSMLGGSPYYMYEGSVTEPPCEQGVKYFIRQDPIFADKLQLDKFKQVQQFSDNYRQCQQQGSLITSVASVDLVGAPHTIVKPKISKLKGDQSQSQSYQEHVIACQKELYNVYDNFARIATSDSNELAAAKSRVATTRLQSKAQEKAIVNSRAELEYWDRMYATTPGLVSRMQIQWKKINAQKMLDDAIAREPALKDEEKKAEAHMWDVALSECVVAKEEVASVGSKQESKDVDIVELPRGLEANPFSDKVPAMPQHIPDKLTKDLKHADLPPSSKSVRDSPKDVSIPNVQTGANTPVVIRMRLPFAPMTNQTGFKESLIKALSNATNITPSRLEVQAVRNSTVHQIASVYDAVLTQRSAEHVLLLRRGSRLRH